VSARATRGDENRDYGGSDVAVAAKSIVYS